MALRVVKLAVYQVQLTLTLSGLKENIFPNNIAVRNVILNNIIIPFDGIGESFC